jgi:hypothetical protein
VPCSYCTSGAVGTTCLPETDAKTLPPSVFNCKYQEKSFEMFNASKPARPAMRKRSFPTPTYEYLTCGSVWTNNVTWTSEGLYTYFAVVNASAFTIVATNWKVIPSSAFSCPYAAYLLFGPISDSGASYGEKLYC